jgi:hypothetical protein
MTGVTNQRVRAVLAELEEHPDYNRLTNPAVGVLSGRFRQEVDHTGILCFQLPLVPAEQIRGHLTALHALCIGELARFRPFIERAQAVIATTA